MVMMSSGFSSPRTEQFPAGLRVLVVDDNPTWLKILEKMLKKCTYEVTTCGLAREALRLLRDRKDGFDIVISDVNMPDMDGFKLLEHVGLEMDLPVIMMSVDGETSRVMKGVQHGACDYLLKPIRMKELKNIWQHVMRKKLNEVRDIEFFEDRNGPDHSNDGHYGGGDQTLLKKRKDVESKHDEKELSDTSSTKKPRVVWTIELHQKFVNAVNQKGIDSDKIGPKKILDLMNVPWLTRENVASHLQKYRLYLSRIRKEDKAESCNGGVKNQDHSLNDPNLGQHNDVNSTYGYPGSQLPVQSSEAIDLDTDIKSSNLLPLTEQRKPFKRENSEPREVSSPKIAPTHPLGSIEKAISYASFDSPVAAQYPCTAEIPEMQFETELQPNPDLDVEQHQHAQAGLLETARHINSRRPSISEINNSKSLNVNQCGNDFRQLSLSPMERAVEPFLVYPEAFGSVFDVPLDVNQSCGESGNAIEEQGPLLLERFIHSFPVVSQTHALNPLGSQPNFNTTLETKDQGCSQGSIMGLDSEQRIKVLERETSVELLGEDLMFCWLQGGDASSKDVGFDYLGLSDSNFPHHVSEAPLQSYVPRMGIDYEYLFDCLEHPFVDQGLLFS